MDAGSVDAQGAVSQELSVLRSGAALSPLEDVALLIATGEDRVSFLQGMLSQEIAQLEEGQAQRALLLTDQGRVVSDLRVLVLHDEIWLEMPAFARDDVQAALERFVVADDVELVHGPQVGIALRGPAAVRAIATAAEIAPESLALNQHRHVELGDVALRLVRVRELGVDTFHCWTDTSGRARVIEALLAAGAVMVSAEAVEVQRLSAGMGRLGSDYGLDTLAPEVPSLQDAISYRKGCYLGQEVVERVAARGQVKWTVACMHAAQPLAPGDVLKQADVEVGRVTSAAPCLDAGRAWALGRIRAANAEPGSQLVAVHGSEEVAVEVAVDSAQEGAS